METVVIEKVNDANASGWIEIELQDGRTVATKDKKISTAAFEAVGKEVQVEIGHTKKGDFDNYYLNSIGNEKGAAKLPPRRPTLPLPPSKASTAVQTAQEDRQASIEAQWAFGRAVELLSASGVDYAFPLDPATFTALQEQAETLLAAKHVLAGK